MCAFLAFYRVPLVDELLITLQSIIGSPDVRTALSAPYLEAEGNAPPPGPLQAGLGVPAAAGAVANMAGTRGAGVNGQVCGVTWV